MMDSKIFDIFLLFVICCSFVYGSPVGINSDGEIPNVDALTTSLPSKTQFTQVPDKALQGNISANAVEIKSNNSTATNEKQSKLPIETISVKNVSIHFKPLGNDTTVPVAVLPPQTTADETAANSSTAKTPAVSVSTTATTTTPANSTTTTTTTSTTTTTTTSATTSATTSTTQSPEVTSTSAVSSTSVKSEKMENDREFDGPSFIGGIVLAFGLTGIGFVAYKFCKARMEMNYRHF